MLRIYGTVIRGSVAALGTMRNRRVIELRDVTPTHVFTGVDSVDRQTRRQVVFRKTNSIQPGGDSITPPQTRMEISSTCNCPRCWAANRIQQTPIASVEVHNLFVDSKTRQMKQDTDTRATAWSVTLFNGEEKTDLPEGWKLEGQMETAPDTGKLHYQGYLKTKQVRFSNVKKVFPKAHIEKARDEVALQKYVHKKATRTPTAPRAGTMNFTKFFEDVFEFVYEGVDRQTDKILGVATMLHDVKTDGQGYWLQETVAEMIKAGATWDYAAKATDPKIRAMWIRFRTSFLSSWLEERERAENESPAITNADDNASLEQDIGGPVGRIDLPLLESDSEGSQDQDGQDDSDSEQDSETGDSEGDQG